jgi:dipeptidyl aminopeptidase/acylaminoacyl peptidase
VLKTMLISKLKTALVVLLAVVAFGSAGVLLASSAADASGRDGGGTSASPGERVAFRNAPIPVPKAKPDPGLIWVYNKSSGALTAYAPDGQKAKELKLADGDRFLGFTPDGQKMASVGTVPGPAIKPTLHLRDMNDKTEGTDTGFPVSVGDGLHWSADGKRVIRVRYASGYSHTLYDLGTKKETDLELPAGHQVYGLVTDGEWLLTVESRQNRGGDVYKVPLGKGKPTVLSNGELSLMGARLSPDGRTVICFGSREKIPAGEKFVAGVYALDIKSGTVTKIAQNEAQNWSKGFWSPDGTRVAYFWAATNTAQPHHLVVCDKDGKNSSTLCTIKDDVQSVDIVGWYPSAVAPPPAPRANP